MNKKILSILLALCMVVTMLPITAEAAGTATYDLTQGSVTIDDNSPETITVNGRKILTANTIKIIGTKNHTLTLNEVYINSTSSANSPVSVDSSGTTTLNLCNNNYAYFDGVSQRAAVHKPVQGTLIIAGSGKLEAKGGYFSDDSGGAAIGGNNEESTANIIIKSGTIQATSLSCAAAIGGGNRGSATNIQITGGNVYAESQNGAAIGGGGNYVTGGTNTYTGRNIVISGGTVKANTRDSNKCMAIGDGNVGNSDGYGMDTSGWGNVLQPPVGMVSKVEYEDNGTQTSFAGNYGTNHTADIARFDIMQISFVAGNRLTVQSGEGSGLYLTGKPVNISASDEGYVEFRKWVLNSGSASIADAASKSTTLTMGNTDVTVTAVKAINYDSLKFALSPVSIKGESGKTQQFTVGATYNGTALTADQMAGLSYTTTWSLTDAANSTISNTGLLTMGAETANIKVNAAIHAGSKTCPVSADVLYKEAEAGDLIISGGLPGTDYTYADNVLTFTGNENYLVEMKPGVTTAATRIVVNGGSPKITLQNVKIGMDSNAQSIFCVLSGSPSVKISGMNSLVNYNGNDNSNGIRVMNGQSLTLDGGDSDTLDIQGNYYSALVSQNASLTIKGGHYSFGKSNNNIGIIKVEGNATCEVLGGIIELQTAWKGKDNCVIDALGDFRIIPAEGKQAAFTVNDSTKYLTEPYSTGTVKFYKSKIFFSDALPAITAAPTGTEDISAIITVNGTSSAIGYYRLYEGGASSTPLAGDIMGNAVGTVSLSKDATFPVSLTGLKEGTTYDCCIVAAAGSGESTKVSRVVKVHFTTKRTPLTASFDKNALSDGYKDIPVILTPNTLSGIKNGSAELVKDADYTVSGSTVTIKKEYLATLKTGDTALIFHFSTGETQTLKVSVTDATPGDSTIFPTSVSLDKSEENQSNITVTMTLNGNTLSSIKNGSAELVKDADYTVSDSTVTIKKEYLAELKTGKTKLVFHFSKGEAQTLTVTVADAVSSSGMISAFKRLDAAVAKQSVSFGTALSKINLPALLKATVDGVSNTWVKVSEWFASINYNPLVPGTYEFMPVLDSGYQIKDSGVQLPHIRVTVKSHSSSGRHSSHVTTRSLPSSVTDGLSNTTADLSGASFPSGVTRITLSVTPKVQNTLVDLQAASVFQAGTSNASLKMFGAPSVYDIKLLDQNGNPITGFTGTIMVKVPLPAGLKGTPHVFRYEESTKTFTDLNATLENGLLVFSTTHFSYYVIAGIGDSITLDTTSYTMPVGGVYHVGMKLTNIQDTTVKVSSSNSDVATVVQFANGVCRVNGKKSGTADILYDVYDNKKKKIATLKVKIHVVKGSKPFGSSVRQTAVF